MSRWQSASDTKLSHTWSGLRASQPHSEGGAMLNPGLLRMVAQGGWRQPCRQLPRQPRCGMQCTAVKPLPATPVTGFCGWSDNADMLPALDCDGRPLQSLLGLPALPCVLCHLQYVSHIFWNHFSDMRQDALHRGCDEYAADWWQQQQQQLHYVDMSPTNHPPAVCVKPVKVTGVHSINP